MRLVVHPGEALTGEFTPPGDKSITHRAWMLGLLGEGALEIEGANPGLDCEATARAARALGADVAPGRITGPGRLREPREVLDCGNSGTTLRLMSGIVAGQPFRSVLSGDDSLRRRPMERVIQPLRAMGATIEAEDGDRPPLAIHGALLAGIEWDCPIASAQVESCLLLAGTFARGATSVTLPGPARDHTLRMLPSFGVPLEIEALPAGARRTTVRGPVRVEPPARFRVPGDFSAAAFFLAGAAATGGEVRARDLGLNPTRIGLLEALERMGAEIERSRVRTENGEEIGDVTVRARSRLRGIDLPAEWLPRMVDEVPALCIAAALAEGRTRITGASELRHKESDRIAALASNLRALGIEVTQLPDGLEILGGTPRAGSVRSSGDHRIAMAFAVLATHADGPVVIDDVSSITTSFPGFEADMRMLGGRLEAGTGARS